MRPQCSSSTCSAASRRSARDVPCSASRALKSACSSPPTLASSSAGSNSRREEPKPNTASPSRVEPVCARHKAVPAGRATTTLERRLGTAASFGTAAARAAAGLGCTLAAPRLPLASRCAAARRRGWSRFMRFMPTHWPLQSSSNCTAQSACGTIRVRAVDLPPHKPCCRCQVVRFMHNLRHEDRGVERSA